MGMDVNVEFPDKCTGGMLTLWHGFREIVSTRQSIFLGNEKLLQPCYPEAEIIHPHLNPVSLLIFGFCTCVFLLMESQRRGL